MGLLLDKSDIVEKTNMIVYDEDLIKSFRKKLAVRKYTDTTKQLFIDNHLFGRETIRVRYIIKSLVYRKGEMYYR